MLNFLETLEGYSSVFDFTVTIGVVVSVIIAISYVLKSISLFKNLTKKENECESKDKQIEELKKLTKEQAVMMESGIKIIVASFLNSNIDLDTKQFISEELSKIKESGANLKKAYEVVEKHKDTMAKKAKESKAKIIEKGTEALKEITQVKENFTDIYSSIINSGD